jgi:hypothetical protein
MIETYIAKRKHLIDVIGGSTVDDKREHDISQALVALQLATGLAINFDVTGEADRGRTSRVGAINITAAPDAQLLTIEFRPFVSN